MRPLPEEVGVSRPLCRLASKPVPDCVIDGPQKTHAKRQRTKKRAGSRCEHNETSGTPTYAAANSRGNFIYGALQSIMGTDYSVPDVT